MKTIGKKLVIVLILFLAGGTMTSCHQQSSSVTNTMSTSQLLDKIKGGWAGQTIGVSFGSHTEFRYQGTFIQDYQSIPWHEGYVQELMDSWPDLYDDIYMDLTGLSCAAEYLNKVEFLTFIYNIKDLIRLEQLHTLYNCGKVCSSIKRCPV